MAEPHVAVLYGGRSAERDVSLNSGAACASALESEGFRVSLIDADQALPALVDTLAPGGPNAPHVVFNALHGRWGEDGCIQGLLELMGLPYTHSGVLASSLCMDKPAAKRVMATAGIPVPGGRVVAKREAETADPLPRPYVLKPLNEGSSVGVHIVKEGTNRNPLGDAPWPFGDRVLCEPYIPGRELTVAVMGDAERDPDGCRALAVTELQPVGEGFYDYDAKYKAETAAKHVIPAPIDAALYAEAMRLSVEAHKVLGCRGVSRTDIRLDPEAGNTMLVLEVNTQPGMTAMSLVPEQAEHTGLSFPALCRWLVEQARCDG